MDSDIIVVKQLPIIVEQLQQIKQQINDDVNTVLALECTEDTYKEIKKFRSQLNKDFNELETKRKAVKKAILAPYDDFESVYKDCVTDIFKPADKELSNRISIIENALKEEKCKDVQAYFREYAQSKGIDFITLDDAQITVSISTSKKSLKDKATNFIDKISNDIAMIDTLDNSAEILVEYKKTFDVSQSIIIVNNRHKLIEAEQQRQKYLKKSEEEKNAISSSVDKAIEETTIADIQLPQEIKTLSNEDTVKPSNKKYSATFTVTTYNIQDLKDLVHFMKERGINYEQH